MMLRAVAQTAPHRMSRANVSYDKRLRDSAHAMDLPVEAPA
jgi:hypothetical protein